MNNFINRPTSAFIAASWVALLTGAVGFIIGLWNADMPLHEKGYYFVILLYGLFSAASLQKTVRDQLEEIPVTAIYYALCWASMAVCIVLLLISLWNADITMSEKGFYIMSFLLSLFGVVATQKNIRDLNYLRLQTGLDTRQPQREEPSSQQNDQD
ncbi:inner membrane protein YiaA [Acinetobacter sp. 3657]|uniref:inner membrane protein YiaA n=1 Tax=Acinetobacter sp. 3657 TaxID=2817764 RepID=UPI002859A36C|nr:putative membrane protein YiaA [Prolinoborus sp. 3657]